MPYYRKKPITIEARQLTDVNAGQLETWITSSHGQADIGEHVVQEHGRNTYPFNGALSLFIHTLEGTHRADPGDWVIKGIQGEFYPCKPDIFDATYEPIDPDP